MAKFNGNIYGKQYANNEMENKKCAVFLQECLTNEAYEEIKKIMIKQINQKNGGNSCLIM